MDNYDEDEHSAAYNRAVFYEFANIVQNYEDTARPPHDDIDFTPADYDSAEFDDAGEPVTLYGVIIFNFGSSSDYNIDAFIDYDPYDDPYFYLYSRLRDISKRSYGDRNDDPHSDSPDSLDDESE
jgi:hypothetical protein